MLSLFLKLKIKSRRRVQLLEFDITVRIPETDTGSIAREFVGRGQSSCQSKDESMRVWMLLGILR